MVVFQDICGCPDELVTHIVAELSDVCLLISQAELICHPSVGFRFTQDSLFSRSHRRFGVPESASAEVPGWQESLWEFWFPDARRHRNCRMDSGSRHKPVRHENAFHIQRMHLLILLFRRSKGSG